MSDEYEYGPGWINVPPESRVECRTVGAEFFTVDRVNAYRIATPKPKRELVVGKWYRDERGIWRECISTDGELAWLRWQSADPAYVWELDGCPKDLGPSAAIDWSTPPRDEAPE